MKCSGLEGRDSLWHPVAVPHLQHTWSVGRVLGEHLQPDQPRSEAGGALQEADGFTLVFFIKQGLSLKISLFRLQFPNAIPFDFLEMEVLVCKGLSTGA